MRIYDVFSWLKESEISIEELQDIFAAGMESRLEEPAYRVITETPENADKNLIECRNMLINEGKLVAYILKNDEPIAVIGYKE